MRGAVALAWAAGVGLGLACAVPASAQTSPPPTPQRIPILTHFVNWHHKSLESNSWANANTTPLRRDGRFGIGYDSLDRSVLVDQNLEMLAHGLVPLVSWWGPDDRAGDPFLDVYLTVPGPRLGLLYEVTGRLIRGPDDLFDMDDPRNAQRFIDDVQHVYDKYWSDPEFADRWFQIDGKPVLFVWLTHAFKGSFETVAATVRERIPVYIVGSDFNIDAHFRPGLEKVVRGLDAVSAYGLYHPELTRQTGGELSALYVNRYVRAYQAWVRWLRSEAPDVSLIPPLQFAYKDNRGNPELWSSFADALDLATVVRSLIEDSRACRKPVLPYVLLASYNEHFEGSSVEATLEYGANWLTVLDRTFAAPVTDASPCPVDLQRDTRADVF